jgi:hypothetical protein
MDNYMECQNCSQIISYNVSSGRNIGSVFSNERAFVFMIQFHPKSPMVNTSSRPRCPTKMRIRKKPIIPIEVPFILIHSRRVNLGVLIDILCCRIQNSLPNLRPVNCFKGFIEVNEKPTEFGVKRDIEGSWR